VCEEVVEMKKQMGETAGSTTSFELNFPLSPFLKAPFCRWGSDMLLETVLWRRGEWTVVR
jgi:hypothetical protein